MGSVFSYGHEARSGNGQQSASKALPNGLTAHRIPPDSNRPTRVNRIPGHPSLDPVNPVKRLAGHPFSILLILSIPVPSSG